jgi:hypothetical protein
MQEKGDQGASRGDPMEVYYTTNSMCICESHRKAQKVATFVAETKI